MFKSVHNVTVLRLATAQALSMTTMNVNIINTALVGVLIAPLPWLATLALSLQFLTSMMTTLMAHFSIIICKLKMVSSKSTYATILL